MNIKADIIFTIPVNVEVFEENTLGQVYRTLEEEGITEIKKWRDQNLVKPKVHVEIREICK